MATQTDDLASDNQPRQSLTLSEAFQVYVQQMPDEAKQAAQPEIAKFVRWLGAEREIGSISASEIGEYSEMQTARSSSADAQERLSAVKTFLAFLKKSGNVETNLAQHLRVRKARGASSRVRSETSKSRQVRLTRAGYDQMTKQLTQLHDQRAGLSDDIQKAAADGDVRENAPLEAARESQGMVMAKIRELESTLKMAVVIDGSMSNNGTVHIGSKVELLEIASSKKFQYQLVEPNESSPLSGKISIASPVGAAILGHTVGEEVAVETPRGKQTYRIENCN